VKSDQVFVLIGRELPTAFFKAFRPAHGGPEGSRWYLFVVAMISFFSMLYFGKAGVARDLFHGAGSLARAILAYLTGPFSREVTGKLSWSPEPLFLVLFSQLLPGVDRIAGIPGQRGRGPGG